MKKRILISLLLILAVAVFIAACNGETGIPGDTDTSPVTDPVTDAPATEDTSAVTDADTTEPGGIEAEPETDDIYGKPIAGSATLKKPYAEKITQTSGTVSLGNAGVSMTFASEFYGHDSAISRDLSTFAETFSNVKLSSRYYHGEFFLAELTGDHYADMAVCADGVLSIYPAVVETNKTFEYNGKIYDSVRGDMSSKYAFGEAITFDLKLPDATLRGTGDFNGDGYNDFVFVLPDGTVVLGATTEEGITLTPACTYDGDASGLYAGDVDGDGRCDLVEVDGYTVTSWMNTDGGFAKQTPVELSFRSEHSVVGVGDINDDYRADIVWFEEGESYPQVRSLFGRGDGFFGPRADELGNTNLYAVSGRMPHKEISCIAIGDLSGDDAGDLLVYANAGSNKGLSLALNSSDPCYDYCIFGMACEDGTYRMYAGGRWIDHSDAVKDHINGVGSGDGDHVLMYTSTDGRRWIRYIDRPMFYQGGELGYSGDMGWNETWWISNTLEPEVVYVDGVYHMLIQTTGSTPSGYYGDYINYACSTDGINFERKIDSPVIVPAPGKDFTRFKEVYGYEIGFNHHELIYVPDDPDGKCFHLYTHHFVNGEAGGYVRMRSADPTVFYWNEREATSGYGDFGNQLAYVSDYDGNGNRLYFRITFRAYQDEDGWRTVPTMYYPADGLNFHESGIRLASVDVADPATEKNHNTYFLGLCTLNGTGEIPRNEDGSYSLLYLATTSNSPVVLDIYYAEAGIGEWTFTLE